MLTIHRPIFNKANTFEKNISKMKWNKLVELIEESKVPIKVKSEDNSEVFLTIIDENLADIELYYNFQLISLNEKHNERNHNFKSINEAMNYINVILKDIAFDRKQIPTA
ncbi:hypothetical protein CD120_05245 [Staphylococcus saprophyticus]|uniref:hypothetical protein n=1 Tax=Staphylococcus saprophyticus TaxID=29385 RepID=UPI000CD19DCE|nr:hypothetical protein [Staphylococcus saprophyticus]PNZ72263.1 hypothetical protein CD120_05245 [Staphylococcus saprophyticus]